MLLQIGCACCLRNLVQEKVISGGFVLEAISYYREEEEEEEEPIGGLFLSIYYDLPLAKRRRRTTQQTAFARDNKKHMI
jgi:hypothetical protein